MHNCLYKYRTNNDTFYKRQFGFREDYPTERAIVQTSRPNQKQFSN